MYTEADEADELYYFTTHCVFFFRFMKRFKKFSLCSAPKTLWSKSSILSPQVFSIDSVITAPVRNLMKTAKKKLG